MMNADTAEERRRLGNHAVYKAEIYKKLTRTQLFIEGDDEQARQIFYITNKPVFCIDSQRYYSDEKRETLHDQIIKQEGRIRNILGRNKLLRYVYHQIRRK